MECMSVPPFPELAAGLVRPGGMTITCGESGGGPSCGRACDGGPSRDGRDGHACRPSEPRSRRSVPRPQCRTHRRGSALSLAGTGPRRQHDRPGAGRCPASPASRYRRRPPRSARPRHRGPAGEGAEPDQREATCLTLSAASTPADTMVSARPMLKHTTSANPRLSCFSWMQSSSTVIAAGHGMSPPVRPNMTIWPVVTLRPAKRLRISSAWARAWASSSSPRFI